MAKRKKTGGRVAGTPNKTTASMKENIERCFDELGGTSHMVQWARANPSEFYTRLLVRLLPKQIDIAASIEHSGCTLQEVMDHMDELDRKSASNVPSKSAHDEVGSLPGD